MGFRVVTVHHPCLHQKLNSAVRPWCGRCFHTWLIRNSPKAVFPTQCLQGQGMLSTCSCCPQSFSCFLCPHGDCRAMRLLHGDAGVQVCVGHLVLKLESWLSCSGRYHQCEGRRQQPVGHSVSAATLCLERRCCSSPAPPKPQPWLPGVGVEPKNCKYSGGKTAGSSGPGAVPGGCSPFPALQSSSVFWGLSCLVSVSLCCTNLPEPLLAPWYK